MKSERVHFRLEQDAKRFLINAANHEGRSLANFLVRAGMEKAEQMRAAGWKVKAPPPVRDGRRKVAA